MRWFLCLMLVTVLILSGCSSDDDDHNGNGNGEPGEIEWCISAHVSEHIDSLGEVWIGLIAYATDPVTDTLIAPDSLAATANGIALAPYSTPEITYPAAAEIPLSAGEDLQVDALVDGQEYSATVTAPNSYMYYHFNPAIDESTTAQHFWLVWEISGDKPDAIFIRVDHIDYPVFSEYEEVDTFESNDSLYFEIDRGGQVELLFTIMNHVKFNEDAEDYDWWNRRNTLSVELWKRERFRLQY